MFQVGYFHIEWRVILCYEQFLQFVKSKLQLVVSDFLQLAVASTSNGPILKRVTSDFFKWITFAASNEPFFATSDSCNE